MQELRPAFRVRRPRVVNRDFYGQELFEQVRRSKQKPYMDAAVVMVPDPSATFGPPARIIINILYQERRCREVQ